MAVAFDAVGPSSAGQSSAGAASPLTWSHTAAAGAAAVVVVAVDQVTAATGITATYGGVSMTQLGSVNVNGDSLGFLVMFGAANVAGGAQTVSVAWGTSDMVTGGSVSYTGAGTTVAAAFGTFQHATGATANPSLTASSTATSSRLVFGLASGFPTLGALSGATSRFSNGETSSGDCGSAAAGDAAGTGGSQTATWTVSAGSWAVGAVEVLTAGSTSGPNSPSAGADLGGATGTWASPGNVTAADGSAAVWTVV